MSLNRSCTAAGGSLWEPQSVKLIHWHQPRNNAAVWSCALPSAEPDWSTWWKFSPARPSGHLGERTNHSRRLQNSCSKMCQKGNKYKTCDLFLRTCEEIMCGSACCLMKSHHFNGIHVTGWLPVMRQSRPAQLVCLKSFMCNLTGSEQSFHTTSSLLLFSTHPPSLWFPLWIIAGLILHSVNFTFPLWDFASECQTLAAIRSAVSFLLQNEEKRKRNGNAVSHLDTPAAPTPSPAPVLLADCGLNPSVGVVAASQFVCKAAGWILLLIRQ